MGQKRRVLLMCFIIFNLLIRIGINTIYSKEDNEVIAEVNFQLL